MVRALQGAALYAAVKIQASHCEKLNIPALKQYHTLKQYNSIVVFSLRMTCAYRSLGSTRRPERRMTSRPVYVSKAP